MNKNSLFSLKLLRQDMIDLPRKHSLLPSQLATRNSQLATRNSQLATRNSQLATRNSQLALILFILQCMFFSKNSICQITCTNAPSGAVVYTNPSSSLWSGTLPSTPIIIDGTLTINSTSATLIGNTDVYFTPGSSVQINAGCTFTISASSLDGCGQYWDGIYADAINEGIEVINNSVISHMENGINAINNSHILLDNSRFIDNALRSVYLFDNDFVTSSSSITNNTFETVTSPLGWAPYASLDQSNNGITIEDCYSFDIGTTSSGNLFKNLNNGILITWGTFSPTSTIGIYGNTFDNIQDMTITGGSPDYDKVGQTFTTLNGAGIYADYFDLP